MKIENIEVSPFSFALELSDGAVHMLQCENGEWRLDGVWIAQGRLDKWHALARAARQIEEA